MANQNIDIVIKAIDDASANIKRIENQINNLAKSSENASKRTEQAAGGVSSSFAGIGRAITGAVAALGAFEGGKQLFGLTSQVEQADIAFTTLLGSQEKAKQMLADIDQFAAKTPFEKVNLVPLTQQLLGMGFAADQALPIVSVLGDSMAALGRSQADLDGVVLAIGQIQTKGKLSAEELMQMAERGLPVYQILQEKLKLTSKEMENIGNNGIKSGTAINALLTGLNERFGGSMAKQAQTLQGQWSNLMDNLKSMVGNAGQGINNAVKGWIANVNKFFDENRPVIAKFVSDVLLFITGIGQSVGIVAGAIWSVISTVIEAITGKTKGDTTSQAKQWEWVLMVAANAISIVALLISTALKGIVGAFKMLFSLLSSAADTVVGTIAGVVGEMANNVIFVVNAAIKAVTALLNAAGIKTDLYQLEYSKLSDKAAQFVTKSWKKAGTDIGAEWDGMMTSIGGDATATVNTMIERMEAYNTEAVDTGKNQEDVGDKIKKALGEMAKGIGGVGDAQGKTKEATKAATKAAKEQEEAFKKLKEAAEAAIKPIIDRTKDTGKEIDDIKEKIKTAATAWKQYKAEGLKALSDVNNEIVNLQKAAQEINLSAKDSKEKSLAERLVEINKEYIETQNEIAEQKKAITTEQSDLLEKQKEGKADAKDVQSSNEKQVELKAKQAELEAKLLALGKEKDFIQSNASKTAIDEAVAYDQLSQAQKIVVDNEKERQKLVAENERKLEAAFEKRRILEAQANQKNIADLKIQTGMKDGIMTASIELEKGKMTEIKDYENIQLANDIANKQAANKAEIDTLTQQLKDKLAVQRTNLNETQALYKQFNLLLAEDTKTTANSMLDSISKVSAEIKKLTALRAGAGLGTTNTQGTQIPKRAFGGNVTAGEMYQVGERGSEYFIPNQNGVIIPNQAANSTTNNIAINMGGVTVRNDSDIKKIADAISQELARKLQIGKLGIS